MSYRMKRLYLKGELTSWACGQGCLMKGGI